VILPRPSVFKNNGKICDKLTKAVADIEEVPYNKDWSYQAYLSFFRASENTEDVICDIRVHCEMKPYFMLLIDLAEKGELDFIKPITYERRKQNEENKYKKNDKKKKN
jgi:hypothetical protein